LGDRPNALKKGTAPKVFENRAPIEAPPHGVSRQDFSLQNASTLPIDDAKAFLPTTIKVLTAGSP
jgi:hypothetical protein